MNNLKQTKCFPKETFCCVRIYYTKEMVQMNCSKRTKIKILGYMALFKKLGIINEQEYKNITNPHRMNNKYQ